jgi:hypothetical protein
MIQAHTFRRLAPLRKWPLPERIAQQLEQVRICDEQERERQIRRELAEFTAHFGIGFGND